MAKLDSSKNEKITKKAATSKKSTKKEATAKTTKTTKAKADSTKKTTSKKVDAKKTTAKKVATKSTATKKATTTKKTTSKKKTTSTKRTRKKVAQNIIEYYDLPSTYNQTTVKLLFQTPKKLFVYWEISEADKQKYFDEIGNDFFETTTPYLVVKNLTKDYSFEVEINDFANSWYFDVPDSNCDYEVALIRKHNVTQVPTLITKSNELEVPNNRILFEQSRKEIFFKNVKTNAVVSKSVVNLQFINHLSNIYNANSFYKKFYRNEDLYILNNPSSN